MSMDIAEYKRIVAALRPSLLTVAHRITGNTEDAEDVVQDGNRKNISPIRRNNEPKIVLLQGIVANVW